MKTLSDAAVVSAVQQRIASLRPTDGRLWGTMVVEDMMAHVREAYVLSVSGRLVEQIVTPLPPAVLKFGALYTPAKWPRNVPTVALLERRNMPPSEDFELERGRLERALLSFLSAADKNASHAYFGPMNSKDWLRWGYLHADHHLRQFGR